MVLSVGLIAGITAGCAFAVGLCICAALIWHWVRQNERLKRDVEQGLGGAFVTFLLEF